MKSEPFNGPEAAASLPGIPQPVAAPLTRAAIFLVATIKPGPANRATIRAFCRDLAALVRAVEFRDIEAGLSCVMGFGSDAWDWLFGSPRPAKLHPFREIGAESRQAVSTPGDLLFHIRAKRMDLCFELETQIMARIGGAISGNAEAYKYLPGSVSKFPSPPELSVLIETCGFRDVRVASWNFSSVILHSATNLGSR